MGTPFAARRAARDSSSAPQSAPAKMGGGGAAPAPLTASRPKPSALFPDSGALRDEVQLTVAGLDNLPKTGMLGSVRAPYPQCYHV
jgi:hypothetical protein